MDNPQTRISFYKKRVGIASLVILAIGLISGVLLVQQTQELREQAASVDVTFFFDDQNNPLEVAPNSNGNTFDIYMNAGGNYVTSLVLEVQFDPRMIEVNSLSNEWMVQLDDNSQNMGRAHVFEEVSGSTSRKITLGIRHPAYTSGNIRTKIATVNFNVVGPAGGSTDLIITTNSQVAGKGFSGNILDTTSLESGQILIVETVPTPTPVVCPLPYTNCNGQCVDTETDVNNCGSCGFQCQTGEVCSFGRCAQPPSTPTPTPTSTPTPSPTPTEAVCPLPYTACSGQCVDLSNDNNNCGSCGNACSSNRTCVNGNCVRTTTPTPTPSPTPTDTVCPLPYTACGGQCVDTETDVNNCGSCGVTCSTGEVCSFGRCAQPNTCEPTNGDANGDGRATPNDYSVWAYNFNPFNRNLAGPSSGDFNCDEFVNGTDFSIWAFYFTPF